MKLGYPKADLFASSVESRASDGIRFCISSSLRQTLHLMGVINIGSLGHTLNHKKPQEKRPSFLRVLAEKVWIGLQST